MKSKVIVPDTTSADDANRLYGDAYGADWEYESLPQAGRACKGANCGSTNHRLHSAECFAEYEAVATPPPSPEGQALMQAKARAVYLDELLSRAAGYLRTCSCESDQAELGALIEKIDQLQTERPRP